MEEKHDEFLDLIDEYSEPRTFKTRQIVSATVVAVDNEKNQVVFDYGGKGENWVDGTEFQDEKGNITVKKGDVVDLMVLKNRPLRFSYIEALKSKAWEKVQNAYDKGETVYGTIVGKNKGGFNMHVFGQQEVFMPNSHSFLNKRTLSKNSKGTKIPGRIIELKSNNAIFSHRQYLEEMQDKICRAIQQSIENGNTIFKGTLVSMHDFGLFVDIGGIEGLVPKSEITYKRFFNIKDEFKINQKVNVKLLKFEEEKKKLILSIKQTQPNPWDKFLTKHKVNDIIEGPVVSLEDFGAFVEIIPGVDGLIHVSEISWTEKIRHPKDILKHKQKVTAKILEINEKSRRVALGLKQLQVNPWEEFENEHPEGTTIEGTVSKIVDNGAEITVDNNLQAFIFDNDITWDQEPASVADYLKEGETLSFSVLKVDKDRQRILLGRKQLSGDPVQEYINAHRIHEDVQGTVISVNPFGLKVKLEEGVQGIVPQKEISSYDLGEEKKPFEDDTITARIIRMDAKDRQIVLSIRRYEKSMERSEIKEYSDRGGATFNLGDLLKGNDGEDKQ